MEQVDVKALDKIVKQAISAVNKSKSQIYDIYEVARSETENVRKELERIQKETADVIFKVDELERGERRARIRLMEVSRDFKLHSEQEIRSAYDDARNIQVQLAVSREHEQNLRRQRDDLELRLRNLSQTVEKAEHLVSQVGAVLDYLGSQMNTAVFQIENLQNAQALGAQAIRMQEEERRRVARDIHDGPAQAIANIVFRAEVCEKLIDTDLERAKAELRGLREHVRECLRDVRKIIFDLRPMALDDLGLLATLRSVLDSVRDRHCILTEITVTGEEKRFESYQEIGIFRIVQEALNNVIKHAEAKTIRVQVEFSRVGVAVVIVDDGKGFQVDPDKQEQGHFGLLGMQERVALLRGKVTIKSEVGRGTRVLVRVPFEHP